MNAAEYRAKRMAELQQTTPAKDWTEGNTSRLYLDIVAEVDRLIRSDASNLLAGYGNQTARLVVSQLAHEHGLVPGSALRQKYETPVIDNLQRQLDGKDAVIEEQRRTIRELTAKLTEVREEIAEELHNKMVDSLNGSLEDFGRTHGLALEDN